MTPQWLMEFAIVPALRLLPDGMDSPAARAMLLAIAAQESGLTARHQRGGPAVSFWQFEVGGVHAVMQRFPLDVGAALVALDYPSFYNATECHAAIEHNDTLAAVFARLLLWSLPQALPAQNAPGIGWAQYLQSWRPGKPRRDPWDQHYADGWETVTAVV